MSFCSKLIVVPANNYFTVKRFDKIVFCKSIMVQFFCPTVYCVSALAFIFTVFLQQNKAKWNGVEMIGRPISPLFRCLSATRRSWKYKFSLRVVRLTNTPHCDRLLRCAPRLYHSDVSIIENINISLRSRYIESRRIGRLNINFFRYIATPKFCSCGSIIYSLTVMPITKNSVTTVYRYLTILHTWYFANDIQYLQLNSNLR